jgi:hypothetical protein
MLFNSVPSLEDKWDRSAEFVPEQIEEEIKEFYADSSRQGFEEVEEEHSVLFGRQKEAVSSQSQEDDLTRRA